MDKLYLLRHARREIHGPFRKGEVKTFLSSHEHLKDWELSGDLGPWIFMENEPGLKENYLDLWLELNTSSFSLKKLFNRKK